MPLGEGVFSFENGALKIERANVSDGFDLKDGYYADLQKLKGSVIRTKTDGDLFTKFGGGTKKVCDLFTDKKIPRRLRENLPLICRENRVLFVPFVGISDSVKVDSSTEFAVKITYLSKE